MNLFDTIEVENAGTGLFFADYFSTIQLFDAEKFKPGTILNATLKNKDLGVVEIVAARKFYYQDIRDPLAFMMLGKPAPYLGQHLTNIYAEQNKELDPLKVFQHIVLHYKKRNLEVHQCLWEDFWSSRTNNLSA